MILVGNPVSVLRGHQPHLMLVVSLGLRLGLEPVLLRRLACSLLLGESSTTVLFAELVFEFYVFLVAIGEVGHVPIVQFLAQEAGTHALLGIGSGGFGSLLLVLVVRSHVFLRPHLLHLSLVGLINGIVLVLSLQLGLSSSELVAHHVLLRLLHGTSTGIRHLVGLAHLSTSSRAVLALLVALREVAAPCLLICRGSSLVHASLFLDHRHLFERFSVRCLSDQ